VTRVSETADHRVAGTSMSRAALRTEAATRLARGGQRLTEGRRTIVDTLAGADRPLTIPEILGASGELAQSSAYRNLAVLEAAGVVVKVVSTDEWVRYELAEDLTGHHHHLICGQCGAVVDIVVPADIEAGLDRELGRVALAKGYKLHHHRLDLIGTCPACRK
jgi:Fe2+ or Zn2+ uptake regulation protein